MSILDLISPACIGHVSTGGGTVVVSVLLTRVSSGLGVNTSKASAARRTTRRLWRAACVEFPSKSRTDQERARPVHVEDT